MAKKLFIGNYKGGVGKTTSVRSIAHFIAQIEKKKVLMLDLDPQSSLSEICLKNSSDSRTLSELNPEETLNYIFDLSMKKIKSHDSLNLKFSLEKLIKETNSEGVSFIPSSLFYEQDLGLDELALRMERSIDYFVILSDLLSELETLDFDYILIDCPPSSNIITQSAFLASDYYVIPTIEDGISTNGVVHYIKTVGQTYDRYYDRSNEDYLLYKHYFGQKPKLIGIFYTLTRGQVNYAEVDTQFKVALQSQSVQQDVYIFEAFTNNYVAIARSISEGKVEEKVNNKTDYENITKELLKRLNSI